MRIFNNLIQALRGLKLNRGNTLLMTLGVMVGIASLTVIVAIGFGIKVKVLNRISNMGFGPESFSVMAGAGKMFFSRSKNIFIKKKEHKISLRCVSWKRSFR